MSKIALSGPAGGTATYTVTAPTGATDRTITLPDVTGTLVTNTSGSVSQAMLASGVVGNGPAFSAYPSASQTIASSTFTKLNVNTEVFDTNSNFDPTTNYRFTPTVAGYYQVTGCWYCASTSGQVITFIYKNGFGYQATGCPPTTVGVVMPVVAFVYMNGSTDYLELYVYQSSGSSINTIAARPDLNYFQAFLARSA
jgi:hypothetical protein